MKEFLKIVAHLQKCYYLSSNFFTRFGKMFGTEKGYRQNKKNIF